MTFTACPEKYLASTAESLHQNYEFWCSHDISFWWTLGCPLLRQYIDFSWGDTTYAFAWRGNTAWDVWNYSSEVTKTFMKCMNRDGEPVSNIIFLIGRFTILYDQTSGALDIIDAHKEIYMHSCTPQWLLDTISKTKTALMYLWHSPLQVCIWAESLTSAPKLPEPENSENWEYSYEMATSGGLIGLSFLKYSKWYMICTHPRLWNARNPISLQPFPFLILWNVLCSCWMSCAIFLAEKFLVLQFISSFFPWSRYCHYFVKLTRVIYIWCHELIAAKVGLINRSIFTPEYMHRYTIIRIKCEKCRAIDNITVCAQMRPLPWGDSNENDAIWNTTVEGWCEVV